MKSIGNLDSLSHHGILGQKWGKMQGPPYPLDYDEHSPVQKRLNPKSELNNYENNNPSSDTGKDAKKINKSKKLGLAIDAKSDKELKEDILKNNPNAAIIKDPGFFQKHKKELLIGAAVGAVAIGTAWAIKNGKIPINKLKVSSIDEETTDNLLNSPIGQKQFSGQDGELNGFNNKAEKFVSAWEHAEAHKFDPISEAEFRAMDDKPIVLNAGSEMFRMSKNEHNSLRDGMEYISFGKDRDRYKGFLPQMWEVNNGYTGDTFYETSMKAKEQIKAPSKKEAILLMEKAVKATTPGYSDKEYHDDVLQNFGRYTSIMIDRNSKIGQNFLKELQKAGYNSVVDYNDAGHLSDNPLILLNGAASASIDSVSKISKEETIQAFQNIEVPKEYEKFSAQDYEKVSTRIAKNYLKNSKGGVSMNKDYIEHHGIKGQHWGVRRFQNEDGTRTAAGKAREREDFVSRTETRFPKNTISEDWGKHSSAPRSKNVLTVIKDKQKENLRNKGIKTAKEQQKYWENEANRNKKYLNDLQKNKGDKDEIKWAKSEQKKYESYAQDWMKSQDNLMKMDLSSLSLKEVKKKTSKMGMVNNQ